MSLAAVVVLAALAQFEGAAPSRLALGVGTDFPIAVGAHARSELPGRLLLGTSLGVLPAPYLKVINRALVEFGAYDETTGDLVTTTMGGALVWRTHLGWRPFASSGFYFSGGYTLAALGGDLTGSEAIAAVLGLPIPDVLRSLRVNAGATAHQAGLELGWRRRFLPRLALEAALGGFYTFSAKARLELEDRPLLSDLAAPILGQGERYLDDTLESYFHGAYLSLRGYFEVL